MNYRLIGNAALLSGAALLGSYAFSKASARTAPAASRAAPAIHSALVFAGKNGRLIYQAANVRGDTIPDFSNCGYRGGGVALPAVPVKVTVSPAQSVAQAPGGEATDDLARLGHGWAGSQMVFWNCRAAKIDLQKPPTSQNYAIGCITARQSGNGFWEAAGQPVTPASLYRQQLQERLGIGAVSNIEAGNK